jgi:hypothetical protein
MPGRFCQGHKNDFRDAHAIAEAVQRPSTRCVPIKTDDQLDLQALHRVPVCRHTAARRNAGSCSTTDRGENFLSGFYLRADCVRRLRSIA